MIKEHLKKCFFYGLSEGVQTFPSNTILPWDDENRVATHWGNTYTIEALNTKDELIDLNKLKSNQMLVRGDGKNYHFLLTKKENNNG